MDPDSAKRKKQAKKPAASITAKKPSPGRPDPRQSKALDTSAKPPAAPILLAKGDDSPSFVVGLGASAGALNALTKFLDNTPVDTGMAFVVVVHLDPNHESLMPELLQRHTRMPVKQAGEVVKVQRDHVYIIPPGHHMRLLDGTIYLAGQDPGSRGTAVDIFLSSLAEARGETAIGIILSGTGSDGTIGLRAIKELGGLTIAQSPESSQFGSMPENAIDAGLVDFVLSPEQMAIQLVHYAESFVAQGGDSEKDKLTGYLEQIFHLLKSRTGNDFSAYKRNTVLRRVERRMAIHRLHSPAKYVRMLQTLPDETLALFRDMLIGVTSFFRDPEAFRILETKILPELLSERPNGTDLRIWIPGVATGQESYSFAILLKEFMEKHALDFNVQIFATDIDERAIRVARAGRYPESIAEEMSPERLARFFEHSGKVYQVNRDIREMLVFATQNIIKDPPFLRMDFICCRNLLIYLNSDLQKNLLPLFHYSLNPDGILFLGTSESIGEFSSLFEPVDAKWKIFRRKGPASVSYPLQENFPKMPPMHTANPPVAVVSDGRLADLTRSRLLQQFAPPCVVTSRTGDILYIHGSTGKYLEPPQGKANWNILEMAREGLRAQLPSALRKSVAGTAPAVLESVRVKTNGSYQNVKVTVSSAVQSGTQEELLMIIFQEIPESEAASGTRKSPRRRGNVESQVSQLEQELSDAQSRLQILAEEMDTSTEELKSVNEEYQSTNEELKSANEELETSREELQSLNEELTTVNADLQEKIQYLSKTHDDLRAFLDSLNVPTLFLDNEGRIKRFTSQLPELINVVESDVGRPLAHISTNLNYHGLVEDAQRVRRTARFMEREVETNAGHIYLMRILPYQTADNQVEGTVVTFIDIHELRSATRALHRAEEGRDIAEGILKATRQPLVILDKDFRVILTNDSFLKACNVLRQHAEGKYLYALGSGEWDTPQMHDVLENILPLRGTVENVRVDLDVRHLGRRTMLLGVRQLSHEGTFAGRILLTLDDITDAKPKGEHDEKSSKIEDLARTGE